MELNFSAFLEGFGTFFVGVGMVFVALLLLIILIHLVGKIVGSIENKKQPVIATEVLPEPVAVESIEEAAQDELELVAVITAVIAASLGTTTDKLQVRSLRQVNR